MKSFHFSLETVLSYKQQLVDAAQAEVAKANQKLEQIILEEEAKQRAYHEEKQNYDQEQQKGIAPQMMVFHNDYLHKLRQEQRALENKHALLQKEQQAAMENLIAIKVEAAALEKLQEKEWQQYKAQAAKEEERLVEELAVNNLLFHAQ